MRGIADGVHIMPLGLDAQCRGSSARGSRYAGSCSWPWRSWLTWAPVTSSRFPVRTRCVDPPSRDRIRGGGRLLFCAPFASSRLTRTSSIASACATRVSSCATRCPSSCSTGAHSGSWTSTQPAPRCSATHTPIYCPRPSAPWASTGTLRWNGTWRRAVALSKSRVTASHARGGYVDLFVHVSVAEVAGEGLAYGIIEDVTERNAARAELLEQKELLAHLADHDALTGLPNRRSGRRPRSRLRARPARCPERPPVHRCGRLQAGPTTSTDIRREASRSPVARLLETGVRAG